MKSLTSFATIFVLILAFTSANAQFRGSYEIEIVYQNFDKLYNKHYFNGEINRYNLNNISNKSVVHTVQKSEFPQNGLKLKVRLYKNESIELKFSLTSKNNGEDIAEYHRTLTVDDIEKNSKITFAVKTDDWNKEALSTQEFTNFLKSMILTREQEAIINDSLHSKLTALPLGTYLFIDRKDSRNNQTFRIAEYDTIEFDSSIPQSSLIMKFSKVISMEDDISINASFSQNKIMASMESIFNSSDFVELSMSVDRFHKKYIKNIKAVHFDYLTEDESRLEGWFRDKIKIINSESDRSRYELHFTTGYKLIDELKITYNSYKDLSKQIDVDLRLFDIVSAGSDLKLTKFKSVKDTLVARDYLVDVEIEDMTNTLHRLADFYKVQEQVDGKNELLRSQLEYSKSTLERNIKLFKSSYNDFLNQYTDKNLPIDYDFTTLNCMDNCIESIIPISRIMKGYDIDVVLKIFETQLGEIYSSHKEDLRTRAIVNSQRILKEKFYMNKDIASEIVAAHAAVIYIDSQLTGGNPLSFRDYMEQYMNSDEYKNEGRPLPKLILEAL